MTTPRKLTGNAVVPPSTDLGPVPSFAWIALDDLVVDERYQRKVTAEGVKHINGIVRRFSWSKFQPLTVTGPDASGGYPVIDGQHRLEAARRHPSVTEVPCWIVSAPEIAAQAEAFVVVNQDRIAVSRVAVFWAELAAGAPEAVWLKGVCDAAGITIGRVAYGDQPPLTTVAIAALMRLRPLGDEAIVNGLQLLARACPIKRATFRAEVVTAVIRILALYRPLNLARLATILGEMDFGKQIDQARVYRKTFGGNADTAFYAMVCKAYNKGLREIDQIPEKAEPVPKAAKAAPPATQINVPAAEPERPRAVTVNPFAAPPEAPEHLRTEPARPAAVRVKSPAPVPVRPQAAALPERAPSRSGTITMAELIAWLERNGHSVIQTGKGFTLDGVGVANKAMLLAKANVLRVRRGAQAVTLEG